MSGQVAPTRMAQQTYKAKKKAAEGGHRLLKKKADALKVSICFIVLLSVSVLFLVRRWISENPQLYYIDLGSVDKGWVWSLF